MSSGRLKDVDGWYDSSGSPCIKFHLRGVAHPKPGIEYEGIIGTGFTGFIQVPFDIAFALRSPLEGTASFTLADGSVGTTLTALGYASLSGVEVIGSIYLSTSHDILLGMEFLRKFNRGLGVFRNSVFLLPERGSRSEQD